MGIHISIILDLYLRIASAIVPIHERAGVRRILNDKSGTTASRGVCCVNTEGTRPDAKSCNTYGALAGNAGRRGARSRVQRVVACGSRDRGGAPDRGVAGVIDGEHIEAGAAI